MHDWEAAIRVAAVSDVGRVREHNEDAVWLGGTFFRDDLRSATFAPTEPLLLAVADGVGGAAAGEVASRWVAERMAAQVERFLREHADALSAGAAAAGDPLPETILADLKLLAAGVNDGLLSEAATGPGRRGMATTYTGLILAGGRRVLLHAGDSRLYALRDGELVRVSRDHTLREESGDPSIPGNIITNCFGTADRFYLDAAEVDPADLYLLCSDGLSDYADMDRATGVLRAVAGGPGAADAAVLEDAAGALLQLALEGGGADNVTALIVRPAYA